MLYSKQRKINEFVAPAKAAWTDTIRTLRTGKLLEIDVRITFSHPHTEDLSMQLESPSGTQVQLHKREKLAGNHFSYCFDGKALSKYEGEKAKGDWILKVKDAEGRAPLFISSWTLNMRFTEPRNSEIFLEQKSKKELTSKHYCSEGGTVKSMKASLNIKHPEIGKLKVRLTSPSGKSLFLHNKEGGSKKNLKKSYKKADLKAFAGQKAKGTWILDVIDPKCKETIYLNKWSLDIETA